MNKKLSIRFNPHLGIIVGDLIKNRESSAFYKTTERRQK